MKDKQGRQYATYVGLSAGDVVQVDGDFTCIEPWSKHTVQMDGRGKYIPCSEGEHYLDGQLTDGGYLMGVYPTK